MDVVRSLADRIIVLHNGRLMADGAAGGGHRLADRARSLSRRERGMSETLDARRRAHAYRPLSHPAGRRLRGARGHARRCCSAATAPARPRRCAPSWASGAPRAARFASAKGASTAGARQRHRAAGVAYVPETMAIFSDLTVSENLVLAARDGRDGRGAARLDFRVLPGAEEILGCRARARCRAARSRCCRSPAPSSSRARCC